MHFEKHRLSQMVFVALAILLGAGERSVGQARSTPSASSRVHAFYYPWYGNPATDGRYANWNHPVAVRHGLPRSFPGGEDIGANFYPQLGAYSCNDPAVLKKHMAMLRRARIGVICVSWWGKDSFTDRSLPQLFNVAHDYGIRINFHVEPFGGRNATTTRDAIVSLLDQYGKLPSLYRDERRGNLPMFYVYDSYLTPAKEWATILHPGTERSIRGTTHDAVVIGLWVKEDEAAFMEEGGFDGFYTYFATDGFTFGSTASHWSKMAAWAKGADKLFIPCVGPGYVDLRIRPWNGQNQRDRENGAYYDRMFEAALGVDPHAIGITSFNEWHEGTQIEPAVPKKIEDYTYENFGALAPTWYLDRTAHWISKLRAIEGD